MRHLRTIAAVVIGARPRDAAKRSAWETFWLSAAVTVTVLGSGYVAYSLWPSALDIGKKVLSTILLPVGGRPFVVVDGTDVSVTWCAIEGVDDQLTDCQTTRISAAAYTVLTL
jgi:hypothetical protein